MFPDRPTAQNKTKGSRISETSRLFERDASSGGSSDTWPSAAKQKMLTAAVGNSSSTQVRFVGGRINLKGFFPASRYLDFFALARLIVHTCPGFLTLHTRTPIFLVWCFQLSRGSSSTTANMMASTAAAAVAPPPPTHSRLPPDGHEFPPEYRDPSKSSVQQVRSRLFWGKNNEA